MTIDYMNFFPYLIITVKLSSFFIWIQESDMGSIPVSFIFEKEKGVSLLHSLILCGKFLLLFLMVLFLDSCNKFIFVIDFLICLSDD